MSTARVRSSVGVAILVGSVAGMAAVGDLRSHTAAYLALYATAALGYMILVWGGPTLRWPVVIVVALALRALLLPGEPTLSDDYHRYIWDGLVQLSGIDPYRFTPLDPALESIQYPARHLINHPSLRTIYPALAQVLFLGTAAAGVVGALGLKLVFGAFELATALVVAGIAPAHRRRAAVTLYLLHPLVIQETWSSAHLEAAPVFCAALAVLLLTRGRDVAAGVALGAAAALKLTPLFLLVPALVGGRARPARFLLGFLPAFLLPYLPYVLRGSFLGSLSSTGASPEFDSSGFWLLRLALPYGTARIVAAGLFMVSATAISLRLRGREQTASAFAWTAALSLLLIPVVFPWYWIAPVTFAAAAGGGLPLWLGLAAPASYASYLTVPAARDGWGRPASYAVLLFATAWCLYRRLVRRGLYSAG